MVKHREWTDRYDDIKHFEFYFHYLYYEVKYVGVNVFSQDYGAYEDGLSILKANDGALPPKFDIAVGGLYTECNITLSDQDQITINYLNNSALWVEQFRIPEGPIKNCTATRSAPRYLETYKGVNASSFGFNKGFRCNNCFFEFPNFVTLAACINIATFLFASFGPFQSIVYLLIEYVNKKNDEDPDLKEVAVSSNEIVSIPPHQQVNIPESEPMLLRMRNVNSETRSADGNLGPTQN
ncbi:hypothetical protein BGZ76_001218 [Entomortierella beljakovae]|nr:hypothetical protein BGZ76_001218 [Entomortierella beljakovae]